MEQPPVDGGRSDRILVRDGALPSDGFHLTDSRQTPSDGWFPTDSRPLADFWPPPMDGSCFADCQNMCELLKGCGLYQGSGKKCQLECVFWPADQQACLEQVVCSSQSNCNLATWCLPQAAQPDLVIKSLSAQVTGTKVESIVSVCNEGNGPAPAFNIDLYYDPFQTPGVHQLGDVYQSMGALPAGVCSSTIITRSPSPTGTFYFWAQVDAEDRVAESDENNNVMGPVTFTVDSVPGIDLSINTFSYIQQDYDSVIYTGEICNLGQWPSGSAEVELFYHSLSPPAPGAIGDKSFNTGPLAKNACDAFQVQFDGIPQGTFQSWVRVSSVPVETDTSNNLAGPLMVEVDGLPDCDDICRFVVQCGYFSSGTNNECLTFCISAWESVWWCMYSVSQNGTFCQDLAQCGLPPP